MRKATTLVLESEDADATAQYKEIMSTLTDAITLAMQCFHDYKFVEAPSDEERSTSRLLGPLQ